MLDLPIKNEFASALLELSRLASTKFIISSQKVSNKPCWIITIIPDVPAANKTAQVTLKNGENPNAETLVVMYGEYSCPIFQGTVPLYFNRGLYIAVEEDTAGVTIQYLEDTP